MTPPSATPFLLLALLALSGLLHPPEGVAAQERVVSRSDSSDMVDEARDRQAAFERFRRNTIPLSPPREDASCDEQIDRICIWFGGEGESDFPAEHPDVDRARVELLRFLAQVDEQIGDPWVLGQRVHYLAERGDLLEAQRVARQCGIFDVAWCHALEGYALHLLEEWPEAEAAFRRSVERLEEEDDRRERLTPRHVVSDEAAEEFEDADPAERERMWELFWRLSDPLYLVEGNDRLTDHFARWVEVRNEEDAETTQGLFWDIDLEETLVRYGRNIGYSRTTPEGGPLGLSGGRRGGFGIPGGFGDFGSSVQDQRSVVGHHHPKSRGYLFPEEFIESPADIPPESWISAPREARTWYAPPYAPEMQGLETQVGRFRRGDRMLVVGAYQPAEGTGEGLPAPGRGRPLTDDQPLEAGLFLTSVTDTTTVGVRGIEPEGVLTLEADPGEWVSGLELLDAPGERAWRARQGVRQDPLVPGLVALSDVMILERGAPLPESFDEALPQLRKGVRIERGEPFTLFWELYGLGVSQPAQITVGFTRGRPGFLERVGSFLGVIEPEEPVEVTFEDPGGNELQLAFRALTLSLPDLEPGNYTLHLQVELAGREPVISSRPIVVE